MPLKHLLHLVDRSGARKPDGCEAELSSCSIYLGLNPDHSAVVLEQDRRISVFEGCWALTGHGVLANLSGVVCDAPNSIGLLVK